MHYHHAIKCAPSTGSPVSRGFSPSVRCLIVKLHRCVNLALFAADLWIARNTCWANGCWRDERSSGLSKQLIVDRIPDPSLAQTPGKRCDACARTAAKYLPPTARLGQDMAVVSPESYTGSCILHRECVKYRLRRAYGSGWR